MGVRESRYWLRQADAIKRQSMASIAYGVRVGMADSANYEKAIKELEISAPKKKEPGEGLGGLWNMLFFMKRGKSV